MDCQPVFISEYVGGDIGEVVEIEGQKLRRTILGSDGLINALYKFQGQLEGIGRQFGSLEFLEEAERGLLGVDGYVNIFFAIVVPVHIIYHYFIVFLQPMFRKEFILMMSYYL